MKSKILKMVHSTAKGLYKTGTISEITMRNFDSLCFKKVHQMKPKGIKNKQRLSH